MSLSEQARWDGGASHMRAVTNEEQAAHLTDPTALAACACLIHTNAMYWQCLDMPTDRSHRSKRKLIRRWTPRKWGRARRKDASHHFPHSATEIAFNMRQFPKEEGFKRHLNFLHFWGSRVSIRSQSNRSTNGDISAANRANTRTSMWSLRIAKRASVASPSKSVLLAQRRRLTMRTTSQDTIAALKEVLGDRLATSAAIREVSTSRPMYICRFG